MKIYTKTGDKGKTSLFSQEKVYKDHIRVEAYGTVDELNSHLGFCKFVVAEKERESIEAIQKKLFIVAGNLATETGEYPYKITEEDITWLESIIDDHMAREDFPKLDKFILPGSTEEAARLHIARTVCRRAERRMISLMQEEGIDEHVLKFVNRLSDVIYAMARYLESDVSYVEWQ